MPGKAHRKPVSEVQRRAMRAAAGGYSTIGIPAKVGREYAKADAGGKLPKRIGTRERPRHRTIMEG